MAIDEEDWLKYLKFDFPDVTTVADFEERFDVPADGPAREERLREWAQYPWAAVTPPPIRALLLPFMPPAAAAFAKASFGGDRSAAGRYAAEQRWKNHRKKAEEKAGQVSADDPMRESSSGRRSTDQKLVEGPQKLLFGRDADGLPRVGSFDELTARYGGKPSQWKSYFKRKYGLKLSSPQFTGEGETHAALGALQALEEVLMNLDVSDVPTGTRVGYDGRFWGRNPKQVSSGLPEVKLVRQGSFSGQFRPASNTIRINVPKHEGKTVVFNAYSDVQQDKRYDYQQTPYGPPNQMDVSGKTSFWLADEAFVRAGVVERVKEMFSSGGADVGMQQRQESARRRDELSFEVARRSAYGTMVHEFGHWLDNRLPEGTQREVGRGGGIITPEGYASSLLREASEGGFGNRQTYNVSSYAQTKSSERLAETFTTWWLYSRSKNVRRGVVGGKVVGETLQGGPVYGIEPSAGTLAEESAALRRRMLEMDSGMRLLKQVETDVIDDGPFPFNHPVTQFALKPVFEFLSKRMMKNRNLSFADVVKVRTAIWRRARLR